MNDDNAICVIDIVSQFYTTDLSEFRFSVLQNFDRSDTVKIYSQC